MTLPNVIEDEDLRLTILKNVEIETRHGMLRADVFLPLGVTTPVPVLMSMSPYGKDLFWGDKEPESYANIDAHHRYMVYELPDPVAWTAAGYAMVRVDSPGTGASPGTIDVFSRRDTEMYFDAVEWAAEQFWSTGKVGILGISYYSDSAIMVAALRPPHLACIVPWEVGADNYAPTRQGGIHNTFFLKSWFEGWVVANQEGRAAQTEQELAARRVDYPAETLAHEWIDDFWEGRNARLEDIQIPFLTAANVTSAQLTLRENIDLFQRASSVNKHLRVHSGSHIEPFYTPEAFADQRAFLDRWLKQDADAPELPVVQVVVRSGTDFSWREDTQWPLNGTEWRTFHIDASDRGLQLAETRPAYDGAATFDALPDPLGEAMVAQAAGSREAGLSVYMHPEVIGEHLARSRGEHASEQPWRVVFRSEPLVADLTVVGPVVLSLDVEPSEDDADLFVALRDVAPDGRETYYYGVDNPETPVALGWLRLSHSDEDAALTTEHWPVQHHRTPAVAASASPVSGARHVRIGVGPTSAVFAEGHRIVLEIASRDPHGSFPFLHITPSDRRTGGTVTVLTGPARNATLTIPVVHN